MVKGRRKQWQEAEAAAEAVGNDGNNGQSQL